MIGKKKKQAGQLLALSALRKRYPDSNLASLIALDEDETIRLPFNIIALNNQLCGGVPYGRIIEAYGEESTGKSLLAMDLAKACQALGGIVLWNDAEASWSNSWAEKNGLDLTRIELLRDENEIETVSDWIADMIIYYRSILTDNEPILLVGDSIAAYETKAVMEVAETDPGGNMGTQRSKAIYQMLRKRRKLLAKYGVVSYFVNQLRQKIGATKWEDPDTTPGGKAMKFYADIRLGLYRGKKVVNRDDKKIGQKVHLRVKKNKVGPPRENIEAKVIFKRTKGNIGYDRYHGLPEALLECRVIKKKGRGYFFEGEKISIVDKENINLLKKIATDDKLRAELIAASPINTISKTRKKIEGIGRNLYPVKLKLKKNAEEE